MTRRFGFLYSQEIMGTDPPLQRQKPAASGQTRAGGVPAPAVRRLSLYLRELERLLDKDRLTVSSKELGETLGYTDAQVRKDLTYFGHFGQPGIGYRVEDLISQIRTIFGTDKTWNVVAVGAGHLGQALVSYRGFLRKGFRVVAVFDNNPDKIGRRIGREPGLEVLPMDRLGEVVASQQVRIGLVTVPAGVAQEVAEAMLAAGIKGILNFAPASLSIPPSVPVVPVELSVHLEQLAYHVRTRNNSSIAE